jgi:hypothetical protein
MVVGLLAQQNRPRFSSQQGRIQPGAAYDDHDCSDGCSDDPGFDLSCIHAQPYFGLTQAVGVVERHQLYICMKAAAAGG